jgi:hypothetical protein
MYDRFYDGTMDEFRLSSTARSSVWIYTEYENQNNSAEFYYFDNPEINPQEQTSIEIIHFKPYTSRKNVLTNPYFEFKYNHAVLVNVGNVTIVKVEDSTVVDTIDITSNRVYGSGTDSIKIYPIYNLELDTSYSVHVDQGIFIDDSMNLSPAINPEEWYFRTKRVQDTPRFSDY